MINVLQDLNEKQKSSVIHHIGPLLVTAGPGTGKTKVITHRIAHLIREYGSILRTSSRLLLLIKLAK